MDNGGFFHPYKWSEGPLLQTGDVAHCRRLMKRNPAVSRHVNAGVKIHHTINKTSKTSKVVVQISSINNI